MNTNKSNQLPFILILIVSFLIESPLKKDLISFQPLFHLLTSVIFYVALFACFLFVLKPNITLNSVVKSICVVSVFAVFERVASVLFFSDILALVYEIIRPLLVLVVIIWANRWILDSRIETYKVYRSLIISFFVMGALFNILEYVQLSTLVFPSDGNIFSYLEILASSDSVYKVLATFFTYAVVFITLLFSKPHEKV